MAELACQYCGKPVGNEGALKQHEDACDHNPNNQPEPKGGQEPRRDVPQRREPAQDARPARQGGGGANLGGTLADAFIAVTDDDLPAEARQDAIKSGLGIVGDAFIRYQNYRQQKMEQQRNRAQNVELEEVNEFPQCNECEYQFGPEDIGMKDSEVRCPGCSKLYRVNDMPGEPA